jgi:hypothetical protein
VHRVPRGVVSAEAGVEVTAEWGRGEADLVFVMVSGVVIVVVIVRQVVGLKEKRLIGVIMFLFAEIKMQMRIKTQLGGKKF